MASPSYRLINTPANRSFVLKYEPFDLTTRWHYHPELELIFFIRGKTNGIIGDNFKEFEEGDLVLLGANFPHVLQENKEFINLYPEQKPFGLILQFTDNFLGDNFFRLPEMQSVSQLIERSKRGIQFKGKTRKKVCNLLLEISEKKDVQKLLLLLEVLSLLSETKEYDYLTNQDYYFNYSEDEERMRSVFEYIYKNFSKKIKVSEVAVVANMTETSFCRYFRGRTLKSFTQVLNEIRIAYSCKILKKKNSSIMNASIEAGFYNLPYFSRTFKKIVKVTPNEYKKSFE